MIIDLSLLSKYRTELMGLSAIGIIMCHACGNNVAMPSVLWQICSLGQVGVSMFFFLSGMGMYYSLSKNQRGGVINWYKARYIKLLVPYLIVSFPYYICESIVKGHDIIRFLQDVTTISYWTRGGGAWFVGAIIPLYLIVPWWHKLLNGKRWSQIPSLIVFITLLCFGSFRHLGEVAFFFVGYEMGKHVKSGKTVNLLLWVLLPIMLYAVCHVVPILDWVPRSLLLVIPFMLIATLCFNKANQLIKSPFRFMGKISFESYMANGLLPHILALIPWVVNGVNLNEGNRLLYLCVIVFGILLAFVVNKISQPIVGKLIGNNKV